MYSLFKTIWLALKHQPYESGQKKKCFLFLTFWLFCFPDRPAYRGILFFFDHSLEKKSRLRSLQVLIQRMSTVAVHFDLAEHVELDVILLHKFLDLRFCARFL